MSYQVLARKWRPKTFREMAGQEHVLKALINALDRNRLHHAYLFTGTRGVGKTTIARILAKCLNCESGVSSEPCGQCSACTQINEGSFIDLIEVDAASRTKVEDTRELLENVQYAPSVGRYKVYLIDEVHMLSNHSFNALLKTLEEPPPHVIFLLATTDPQKLPATILSRCLQFNLKNMSPELIVEHLKYVLEQEMVAFDEPALWLLGRSADGSMRDALSLTDQAIAFGSGKLSDEDVRSMLGTIDRTAVFELLEALASSDGAKVLAAIEKMAEQAPDYSGALEELLSLLHRVAITQAVPGASDNSLGDQQRVVALAAAVTAEDVQLFYQMALVGRRDLPMAPDPRSGFEMVLLRMLAFRPAGIPELPQAVLGGAPAAVAPVPGQAAKEAQQPVKKPEAARQAVARPPVQPTETAVNTAVELTSKARGVDRVAEAKTRAVAQAHSAAQVQAASAEIEQQAPAIPPDFAQAVLPVESGVELAELTPANWSASFDQLGFGGVVGNIASHCVLQRIEQDTLHFVIDEANATLFNDSYSERIAEQLCKALSQQLKVNITIGPVPVETPAALKARTLAESKQHALDSLNSDVNVRCLIEDFGATLNPESVAPIH